MDISMDIHIHGKPAHLSTNRARRRVTLFHLKRVTNYATPPTSALPATVIMFEIIILEPRASV